MHFDSKLRIFKHTLERAKGVEMNFFFRLFRSFFWKSIELVKKFRNEILFMRIRVGMQCCNNKKKILVSNKYAIVIQGLIKGEMIFDIIKYYRWSMKKAVIILSTWDTTDSELVRNLQNVVDYLIINEEPPVCGRGNVNYQIKSTLNGLLKAQEIGAEIVLKVRSNSLLMAGKLFEFYEKMSNFGVEEGTNYGLKARILTEYRENFNNVVPFSLCDFTFMGYTEDIIKLWRGGV